MLPPTVILRRLLAALLLSLAVVPAAACGGDSEPGPIVLDGRPRIPDDEGVVTAVSDKRLTIDGDRTYRVAKQLRSFSAIDLSIVPLVHHRGQYVQVGVRDGTVVWIGRIAALVRTTRDSVFYVGTLKTVEATRVITREGTVIKLAPGLPKPVPGRATIEIDAARHLAVVVTQ